MAKYNKRDVEKVQDLVEGKELAVVARSRQSRVRISGCGAESGIIFSPRLDRQMGGRGASSVALVAPVEWNVWLSCEYCKLEPSPTLPPFLDGDLGTGPISSLFCRSGVGAEADADPSASSSRRNTVRQQPVSGIMTVAVRWSRNSTVSQSCTG